MNKQQGPQRPWSLRQQPDRQQSYAKRKGHWQRFLLGINRFLLFALLLTACGSTAQEPQPKLSFQEIPQLQKSVLDTPEIPQLQKPMIASQVDKFLAAEVRSERFSGSVLITQDGATLFSKGYGMADWDDHMPNTPHTKFHVGSLTKQFTAMATLILQEQGKLHVQDHICTYIPNCPIAWQPVTIHHLLTHTSGIPELVLSLSSPQQLIATYKNIPLLSAPGSTFRYSNGGYQLLGYIIQQVAHEPYATFLQQAIFNPLQMRNTGFDPDYPSSEDHAKGYRAWDNEADPIDGPIPPALSFLYAAGVLYSTVEDLSRWDQSLYTHTLVSPKTLDEMFTPYVHFRPVGAPSSFFSEFSLLDYGYGWIISRESTSQRQLIWHYGIINGFRAFIGRYPDDKVSIFILSNMETTDELELAGDLEKIVFANI